MATQTRQDLEQQLAEQIAFIKTSVDLYDGGSKAEAKRLAVSIRVLVHDTKTSRSLLGQLGMKARLFVDTSTHPPKSIITSHTALVGQTLGGEVDFLPYLSNTTSRHIPFDDWWDGSIIVDNKQRAISRKQLVIDVCNTDGGAHVDPELKDIYAELSRDNSLCRSKSSGTGWEPVVGIELATVRQIAHEILKTLLPEYEPLPPAAPKEGGYYVIHGIELVPQSPAAPALPKVGRNDRCPCGSDKKYKRCHGAPNSGNPPLL